MTRTLALLLTLIAAPAAAQDAAVVPEMAVGWAMLPALEGVDLDGDGLFAPEELGATQIPETFDLDGDGLFSTVELSQGYFALHDADDSGLLEEEELRAMKGLAAAGLYEMGG